ncbi:MULTISPECIES: glycoside hydrolase family 15 protein [Anaeromyxobacter]|uniref:glycoside hydrolase family 15 protein n=1 Tax=Anaeromyxobacter TaxID=161492 RepID=UPI001F568EBB|nr:MULTISPECIES: glycoside hydrolase family 15 protein [unclassified Anaeromyxobacter]
MPASISEHALLGDTHSAALVASDGSIDWACLPRFDSPAVFAALLGDERHGLWRVAPLAPAHAVRRRYRPGSLVLETELDTPDGTVRLVDFMPPRRGPPRVLRIVEGVRGRVEMRMELAPRFGYGAILPWVWRSAGQLVLVGGPDALAYRGTIEPHVRPGSVTAEFALEAGASAELELAWFPSHERPPNPEDPAALLAETDAYWTAWSGRVLHAGPWRDAVVRSLVTLKALTYAPTGGIVAAPTTSLPERLGGERNWDYRYCWVRDAALTLYALLHAGYRDEARAWRDWLLRAVAGAPEQVQVLYGVAGERQLPELILPWLPGHARSAPVRVGNAAAGQRQLDVFGELLSALHATAESGVEPAARGWEVVRALVELLESRWQLPDEGIWEVRGGRRHFTHSKVMAWVAFDRAARAVERFGLDGPAARWRRVRDDVHAEVCRRGYDAARGTFTQTYGSAEVDASLLTLPLVGFLPPHDRRVLGTVRAVERDLVHDGLVRRYRDDADVDGLPPGEGYFLPSSFWLVDALAVTGRVGEARALFERLLSLRNDVGLLSEEYDPAAGLLGNFPQAFTHVALVNSARVLAALEIERPPSAGDST